MAPVYVFHPMTSDHLPVIRRWLQTPHVSEWWHDPAEQFELVSGDLDHPDIAQYHRRGGRAARSPICNAMQSKRLEYQGFGSHNRRTQPAASISSSARLMSDMLWSPPWLWRFIRQFADQLLKSSGTPRVVIDPDPAKPRGRSAPTRRPI